MCMRLVQGPYAYNAVVSVSPGLKSTYELRQTSHYAAIQSRAVSGVS